MNSVIAGLCLLVLSGASLDRVHIVRRMLQPYPFNAFALIQPFAFVTFCQVIFL